MSDRSPSPTAPRPRPLLPIVIALLLLVAAGVYFGFVRDHGPKSLKVALVTWTEDPFWDPLIRGAQDCANRSNVQLTVIRSKPTPDAQTQHVRELLDAGIDGIAISPNDAQAQAAILGEAANKVPVVTFDTDAPDIKRRRFVGIDNYAAGRVCADELREALPDGGAVIISVGSVTQQHGRDRRQGLIDGLLERGFDRNRQPDPIDAELKGSKYAIATTVTDGADAARATDVIAAALKAHPEAKAIVGLFSYSAPAALDAMKAVGRAGQLKVVGFDDSDATQAAIQSGAIHSSILQDTYRAGYESVEVLVNEARGVARGPAEQSPILNVGINVLTDQNLSSLRESGAVRQPADNAATTRPAT